MSENEGSESRSIGAFLLGFLTGVLVCLGAGGALFMVQSRRNVEMMRRQEMRAREDAGRRVAEETLRKAKEAIKDIGEDVLPKPKELVEEKKEEHSTKEESK